MRFMMIIRSNEDSESGKLPPVELLEAMGRYNEELVKAGVLLGGEGLHPSSKGARVKFSGGKRTIVDGPFSEVKELIAGFWILQVKSKAEAIEWASRIPGARGEIAHFDGEFEIELRQVHETEEFAAHAPEVAAHEEQLRKQIEEQHGKR